MSDAPRISGSSKQYQERMEPDHRNTRRYPGPHHDLVMNAAHALPLDPPLPRIDVLHAEDDKPPDSGLTGTWPWPATPES
jgi:hypothetical protein